MPDAWLIIVTWNDFCKWEKSWPLRLRLRWRLRFMTAKLRRSRETAAR